jgi:hypothetical protein
MQKGLSEPNRLFQEVHTELMDAYLVYSNNIPGEILPENRRRLLKACRRSSHVLEHGSLRGSYKEELIDMLRTAESCLVFTSTDAQLRD